MQCIARLSLIMEKNVKKCHCIKNIVYSGLFFVLFSAPNGPCVYTKNILPLYHLKHNPV